MKIIQMKLIDIKPYDKNPRKNDGAVDMVANSIKEFGFKVPIIVDKNNIIVAGHTRHKAAKKLGLKEVPVIVADDLTDEQIKAFRLADNKVGGGLHGKDLSKADVSVNIYAFKKAQETGKPIELFCAIGDEFIDGKPYADIVEEAREYINKLGGFEKFAEWGMY